MKGKQRLFRSLFAILIGIASLGSASGVYAQTGEPEPVSIESAEKINSTTVELKLNNGKNMLLDFYGNNIFRLFRDDSGKEMRSPEAKPEAEILVSNPRRGVDKIDVETNGNQIAISTDMIQVVFDKESTLFQIANLQSGYVVVRSLEPIEFEKDKVTITLSEGDNEYFYGGGVQNGRFSHKGKAISIENQNSWTDGGVASPTPFYWSTDGYGVMWYTFKKGKYDFGATEKGKVELYHESDYLDMFLW